ncbi:MAG: peptidase M15 [Legionellales bacterium]|nr:peptidase M15 [Legionellales bacterium]
MLRYQLVLFISLLFVCLMGVAKPLLPEDFVYLSDMDPTIIQSTRYYTYENFTGRPVPGYQSREIVSTRAAAKALTKVNADLRRQGYQLVVYDAYRPQQAVNAFIRWSRNAADTKAKAKYYPTVNKKDVFKLGYVAQRSGHSRGSTFDLTIIPLGESVGAVKISQRELTNGESIPFLNDNTVDMGSSFDLFNPVSYGKSRLVTKAQQQRRALLRNTMVKYGFVPYRKEWWHYTLRNEPHPKTYYDFVVSQ